MYWETRGSATPPLRHSASVRYLGGIYGGGGVQPDGCHWSGREFFFPRRRSIHFGPARSSDGGACPHQDRAQGKTSANEGRSGTRHAQTNRPADTQVTSARGRAMQVAIWLWLPEGVHGQATDDTNRPTPTIGFSPCAPANAHVLWRNVASDAKAMFQSPRLEGKPVRGNNDFNLFS